MRTACPCGTSCTTWSRSTAPSCRPRRSRGSPIRCWRRSAPGRRGRWTRSTRWCSQRDLGGVRDNQVVQNKPAYLAVGTGADGEKHVLGIWLAKTAPDTATAGEGARFWGGVMADLRNRGVRDVLIACCDGLPGFEDAITSA